MVQNKQKFNKINIAALLTSFLISFVFMVGFVQYVFAASSSEEDVKLALSEKFSLDLSNIYYMTSYYKDGTCRVTAINCNVNEFDVYAAYNVNSSNDGYFGAYCKKKDSDKYDGISVYSCSIDTNGRVRYSGGGYSDFIKPLCVNYDGMTTTSNFPIYDMSGLSSDLSYSSIEKYGFPLSERFVFRSEYDENIPTPKSLEVYFDRKLNKPFNLSELCNPLKIKWTIPGESDYSKYTLDVQIDVDYNKLNSIGGIGTKPTILQTGKVEFASCSATDKELNISSTYSGWAELSKKYQNSTWGLTGNYFDLWFRYKDSNGNYGNWVKVTINPDNSSTVVKAGLFDNGTNTTINKGYEEINGDSGEHVKGDYDNYYVDTVGDDVSNNLTSLKNNYSNLVSFFEELFGFLPTEIWVLLIGLVSTMVIIAVVKFVKG